MKHILLFGAGKSATVLIDYLVNLVQQNSWHLTVADQDRKTVEAKLQGAANTSVAAISVNDEDGRAELIRSVDLVISLLPPSLHYLVAIDCLQYGKHLLTASYVDDRIRELQQQVKDKKILFLCEMGLDPGIDHMSAMEFIQRIKSKGHHISAFYSHCGGLVAPESDDNPWHYKISWNPRNVVLAGKAGAEFLENGKKVHRNYEDLFDVRQLLQLPDLPAFAWYPNRDSLSYIPLYELEGVDTFVRTTLRHPEFLSGWKNLVKMSLTREDIFYETDGKTLQQFFQEHLNKNGYGEWLEHSLSERFQQTKELLEKLSELFEVEEEAAKQGNENNGDMMFVDPEGEIREMNIDDVKIEAVSTVTGTMKEATQTLKQLFHLGLGDDATLIDKGNCSAADVLQYVLEQKLKLNSSDKDMIVMVHEIEHVSEGRKYLSTSYMVIKGEDNLRTAMAKTVGLPLGIAANFILQGKIDVSGVHIPTIPEIYFPVLHELRHHGIVFHEHHEELE